MPRGMNNEGTGSLLHCPYSSFLSCLDPNLRHAWRVFGSFSSSINNAALTKAQLPRDLLIDTMACVMYSLLDMGFAPGCLDEVVRLGLLAFGSGIFLQWPQGFPLGPSCLPGLLRENLSQFKHANDMPHLMLWLLIIGQLTVFSKEDDIWLRPWLKANREVCGVGTWDDMRAILHSFPWVDIVHEHAGRATFAEVL
jgi:hypothetical protein